MSEYCKQCGKKDHGTAGCYTNDDKPIYSDAMDVIAELKKKLSDMQCCGNCATGHMQKCDSVFSFSHCDKWQSDGLTKEQRKAHLEPGTGDQVERPCWALL